MSIIRSFIVFVALIVSVNANAARAVEKYWTPVEGGYQVADANGQYGNSNVLVSNHSGFKVVLKETPKTCNGVDNRKVVVDSSIGKIDGLLVCMNEEGPEWQIMLDPMMAFDIIDAIDSGDFQLGGSHYSNSEWPY